MAVCADREGAVFSVWEARGHRGSQIVNEHGSVNFNDLHTRDPEAAKAFYGAVFGWGTLPLGGGFEMWALPGYGDFLEEWNPGTRKRMIELGAPAGFEDVIGSLAPIPDDQPDTPPHWGITFAVDDADAIAAKTQEPGGTVIVPPLDAPWVRMTIIADPQGAVLTASKFVPENKDMEAPADRRGGPSARRRSPSPARARPVAAHLHDAPPGPCAAGDADDDDLPRLAAQVDPGAQALRPRQRPARAGRRR